MRTAYLLVSHGSSDPRHQIGLTRLAYEVQQVLSHAHSEKAVAMTALVNPPHSSSTPLNYGSTGILASQFSQSFAASPVAASVMPLVGTATLEANELPLSAQICAFARGAITQNIRQIVIVPLFLLAGIHVKEDLPQEVAQARAALSHRVRLQVTPYLGSYSRFKRYIAQRLIQTDVDGCILLAHGSRRTAGNRAIQQLGTNLNAAVAFWSVAPDLETQVFTLMQSGHQRIAIAPYFLFPGGLTDAITRQTEDLAERLPKVSLRLLPPLGTKTDLAQPVADLALSATISSPKAARTPSALPIAENSITA